MRLVLFLLLIQASTLTFFGQSKSSIKNFNSFLEESYRIGDFSGIALISQKGKVKYDKAFGYAEFQDEELLTSDTEFNLNSGSDIAKLLSIALLLEEKKIDPDNQVANYLPELNKFPELKVYHLLTHTSGLTDIKFNNDVTEYVDYRSLVKEIAEKSDSVVQGKISYSYTNSILIGAIIESISNEKFPDYFYKSVGQKIDLPRSEFTVLDQILKYDKNDSKYAHAYVKTKGEEIIELLPEKESYHYPEGALFSSGNDILKMIDFLFNSEYISKGTYERLFNNDQTPFIFDKVIGQTTTCFGFEGNSEGYNSIVYYIPDSEISLIILCNYGFSSINSQLPEILNLLELN
ncbi:serine hydrolase domain-containing protein [Marinigracilibium pacificum]|uniref:Beta-lactamase family protein n=1 Tax=Marinigracilibium pacificum TaxID=2729599 RepID=A0A848J3A8_9BACT|nr:serine hydrolase domain-containing protein [Marinigracilibium pacificum]NMM50211.1 beta-lactamase family protein [Marinigracilibium pacificum]